MLIKVAIHHQSVIEGKMIKLELEFHFDSYSNNIIYLYLQFHSLALSIAPKCRQSINQFCSFCVLGSSIQY